MVYECLIGLSDYLPVIAEAPDLPQPSPNGVGFFCAKKMGTGMASTQITPKNQLNCKFKRIGSK